LRKRLDALEALYPGELERILVKEIERYYDTSLDDEIADKAADIEADLDEFTAAVHEHHAEAIAKLETERKAIVAAIKSFKRKAAPILREIQKGLDNQAPDLDSYDWPEPAEGDEDDDPMFDSTRSYVDQVARYKEHQGKSADRKPRKKLEQYTCICEVCGKSFQSARPKARACNPSHRTTLWRRATS
jgi:RNA polymerase-binding transcription factor DksA